jgi:lipoyl(octanoyl) transferase
VIDSIPRDAAPDGSTWRLILDGPHDGASNMAIDEALFEGVQTGGRPVLRLYGWQPACLSFGRNQCADGVYDTTRAHALGIDIVRRPTGGQAVYHDHEITYAVAIPVGRLGGPRDTYAAIHRALAAALVACGVPAIVHRPASADAPADPPDRSPGSPTTVNSIRMAAHPCFQSPAAGEVTAAGRKLVGSAQRCERRTLLQHGSILIDGDQSVAAGLQIGSPPAPASAGILDFLGAEPDASRLRDAIVTGFERECAARFDTDCTNTRERARSAELEHRYRSEAWTWRR